MSEAVAVNVDYGNPDDEFLPITRCVCGKRFKAWETTVGIYEDDPTEMPCCGAKLYFRQAITVYQVVR